MKKVQPHHKMALPTSPTSRGALAQLGEKGYADRYRARGEPIHPVAVEFSRATRNVVAFAAERA